MNLKEIFDSISRQECFGYAPASSSTKPAHIANGWLRRLVGKTYDPVLLNDTAIHWQGSSEVNPSEPLLEGNKSVFDPFLAGSRREEFVQFRANLRGLISPYGGAVNRGNNRSSYNITCQEHLTKDFSDNSVGAFLYHLVRTDCGSGPSLISDLLVRLLQERSDELAIVTLPLTQDAVENVVSLPTYPASKVFRRVRSSFSSAVLQSLRVGFDQLGAFEAKNGDVADTLRRAVVFGVFAVMLHMVNRGRELEKKPGLTPMLLYFQGKRRTTVQMGSHQTYTLCRQVIEHLYVRQFRLKITDRLGEQPNVRDCQKLIKDIQSSSPAETKKQQEEALNLFNAYRTTSRPIDALASSLTDVAFRLQKGNPTDFYRGLGVRVGMLRPSSGTRKHFTLDGALLEAVLASVVGDSPLSYQGLLDLLYDRYGLLTGGRPADANILLDEGIDQVTVADLRENSKALRHALGAMGWARAYADGVVSIQVPDGECS